MSVQREAGRRRLRRFMVVLAVLAVLGGVVAVVLSPLLAVDEVAVSGAGDRADAVRAAATDELGSPLLLVDTGALEAQVERMAWVAAAKVTRDLPNTLRITVTPRVGVAWLRGADGRVAVVDGDGVVIETITAPPAGLVEILGVREPPAPGARLAAGAPARVAAALGPLAGRVATLAVTDGEVVLRLAGAGGPDGGGVEVRFGGLDQLAAKARAAAAVLSAVDPGAIAYVDVRVPSAPVTG